MQMQLTDKVVRKKSQKEGKIGEASHPNIYNTQFK
jgi:hypothetical protein